MTTPATPSDPQPAGDDRNLIKVDKNYVAPSFEDWLHRVWNNNRTGIAIGCGLILLVVLGKGVWELYESRREAGIEQDYAMAATPEKLKAFAGAHPTHALSGLAELRLADDAYVAGRFAEAIVAYDQAVAALKEGPLAARAQLGGAIAKLQAGKTADGESTLKQLSHDGSQLKGIRAEATYHLASFAADAGKADDVVKYSDQLMQLDPASTWTQRALALRSNLLTVGVAPHKAAVPGVLFNPG